MWLTYLMKKCKLTLYETITADEYCAELEARKAHPNCKIGQVTRMGDYMKKNYPNVQTMYMWIKIWRNLNGKIKNWQGRNFVY